MGKKKISKERQDGRDIMSKNIITNCKVNFSCLGNQIKQSVDDCKRKYSPNSAECITGVTDAYNDAKKK